MAQTENDLPRVQIKTSKGDAVVELFEDDAPNTVANFISLVEKKFYDGLKFHRVIDRFMAQGGCPKGSGGGGPGYAIACECQLKGASKHARGSLSMAHAGRDTGGSQFFITFEATPHLDGKHTVFGQVVEGMNAIDKLNRTAPGVEPDTIESIRVLRKRSHAYAPKTLPSRR
ncbi:MAG TPA: peptidylprolyl isomerase [Pirellulales bacterium]|jgi:cyclophilin family peptidyl-prolyl cis-trans isomerase|nr:peptidylprolyl isomerase [Pirellulales bacterium]